MGSSALLRVSSLRSAVSVYDLGGNLIVRKASPGVGSLSLSASAGVRLVSVRTSSGALRTFKILI